MSVNNFFSFKGIVNKPGVMKRTPNNFEYVGLSVGIPKFNKQEKKTEYMNVYVKVWGERAQNFIHEGCKGAWWFSGSINAYQNTSGGGQGQNITEFTVELAEKLEFIPRQQNGGPQWNGNPSQSMPAGTPAQSPNNFPNNQGAPANNYRPRQQAPNNQLPPNQHQGQYQQPQQQQVFDPRGAPQGSDPNLPF